MQNRRSSTAITVRGALACTKDQPVADAGRPYRIARLTDRFFKWKRLSNSFATCIYIFSSTLSLTAFKIRFACSRIGVPWQIKKGHVLVHITGQHVPPQRLYYFLFSASPPIWKRASRTGHSSKPNRSDTSNDKERNSGNKLR